MFSSTATKMSLETSDLQTDEDCEDLVEDGFSFSADISEHEKRTRTKRCLRKPPSSPRSPYLSSLNVNPRRPAVPAWKPLRSSVATSSRGERVDSLGEAGTARFTSLSNGHGLLQTVRSECDVTPEFLKQATKKTMQSHSASNGYSLDHREKEDMYDEIIHLKKSLQAQRADNQQMKAKLRRLEEDTNKREKQIEELLDPTKGSEYTRSLVDKKNEGSVVLNGLKQRILKLEQQCREKENALSKLQSELRTTNLEEMKIMVETYFEEIQRLRMLVEAAEKSSRAESKGSQRQQKALGFMVQRLSSELKQLQQENGTLREELNTGSPVEGAKGYREWSKQRLLRRLLEVEKRLEDSRRHAHSAKSGSRLDQGVQTTAESEVLVDDTRGVATATEPAESGLMAPSSAQVEEEACNLRERVSQLERDEEELQHTLTNKDEELSRLRAEKEESERETERWKAEQADERDKERQRHIQELEELRLRIQALEEERRQAAAFAASSPTTAEQQTAGGRTGGGGEGQTDAERKDEELKEEEECGDEELRERAARSIQAGWREHRDRDLVKMQSAIRGHLRRHTLLRDLQKEAHTKASLSQSSSEVTSPAEGELDAVALTMIQSVFRGHLARCSVTTESSKSSMPSSLGNLAPTPAPRRAHSKCTNASTGQTHPPDALEPAAANAMDSDSDSDDIIVSPSRPLRAREKPLF